MGALTSRQHGGVEEVDVAAADAYKYPPKSGSYFGRYFIMGGERFDTPQPEAYLFGENGDLNFLGSRPTPFPYPAPQPNEPTKTLKSLVNIRKESLRFVRTPEDAVAVTGNKLLNNDVSDHSNTRYNIEFTFDSDARCAITILYFCTEEITSNGVIYTPRDPSMNSETFHYKRGANQQFNQVSHVFDPSRYTEDELNFSLEKEIMPIVIQCNAEEGDDPKQSHITVAVVEKTSDGCYSLKPLKQKQFVDGLCYLLQEIYGIENKNAETVKTSCEDEVEDNGSECVICMSDTRDTLILPCRHLCLCNCCADSLRYQANNCPICRAPFRALLQIRALRKSSSVNHSTPSESQENIPQGYEAVSLIEALNGPPTVPQPLPLCLNVALPPILPPVVPAATAPTQQDAITSPSIPVRGDTTTSRPFAGSFSSLQVVATTEDSASQTDCPMELPPISCPNGPELSVALGRQDSPVVETSSPDSHLQNQHIPHCVTRSPSLDPEGGALRDVSLATQGSNSSSESTEEGGGLTEAQSLLEVRSPAALLSRLESKTLSVSTPDSLHLCESKDRADQYCRPDISPVGEDSDYYTPEDPNLTILSEHVDPNMGIRTGGNDEDYEVEGEVSRLRGHPPSYLEAVSLPGTPLSHSSNRSSGDSFSSMSSTRLLLPNQSQETLAEDRTIP